MPQRSIAMLGVTSAPMADMPFQNTVLSIHAHVQHLSSQAAATEGALRTVLGEVAPCSERLVMVLQTLQQLWLKMDELKGQFKQVYPSCPKSIVLGIAKTTWTPLEVPILQKRFVLVGMASSSWEPLPSHEEPDTSTSTSLTLPVDMLPHVLPESTFIKVVGLTSRVGLNGKFGFIESFNADLA
jgi:hypothetical protein